MELHQRYAPHAGAESMPVLDQLVGHALAYYRDFVKPNKAYRPPGANERAALAELADWLDRFTPSRPIRRAMPSPSRPRSTRSASATASPTTCAPGSRALYEILLGQSEARFGSFVAFYGPAETTALIRRVLRGERPDQSAA